MLKKPFCASIIAISALIAATAACAGSAQTVVTTTPAVATAAQPTPAQPTPARHGLRDPNAKICKFHDVLGSRLGGTTTCHTWVEWDEISHRHGDAVRDAQLAASHTNPNGQ